MTKRNLEFEEVKKLLNEVIKESLESIEKDINEYPDLLSYKVGWMTKEELVSDFIIYMQNSFACSEEED
jgi:hypothetical protein